MPCFGSPQRCCRDFLDVRDACVAVVKRCDLNWAASQVASNQQQITMVGSAVVVIGLEVSDAQLPCISLP